MFDKKMREPRKSVADHQTQRKIKPVSASDNPHEQNNAERCADEMQIARQRLRVFSHVKIPKFRIGFYFFVIYRHNFHLIADAKKTALILYRKKKKLATVHINRKFKLFLLKFRYGVKTILRQSFFPTLNCS